jgi:hypothetical protein
MEQQTHDTMPKFFIYIEKYGNIYIFSDFKIIHLSYNYNDFNNITLIFMSLIISKKIYTVDR